MKQYVGTIMSKTRGEIEADITRTVIKIEKEFFGRGSLEARTFLVNDMILVRLRGGLTLTEKKLAETAHSSTLIKETRRQLFETSRPLLIAKVKEILGCEVLSFHSDVSTKKGERVVVLSVEENLEKRPPV
jgi:uncharacterized protein YbcI